MSPNLYGSPAMPNHSDVIGIPLSALSTTVTVRSSAPAKNSPLTGVPAQKGNSPSDMIETRGEPVDFWWPATSRPGLPARMRREKLDTLNMFGTDDVKTYLETMREEVRADIERNDPQAKNSHG